MSTKELKAMLEKMETALIAMEDAAIAMTAIGKRYPVIIKHGQELYGAVDMLDEWITEINGQGND